MWVPTGRVGQISQLASIIVLYVCECIESCCKAESDISCLLAVTTRGSHMNCALGHGRNGLVETAASLSLAATEREIRGLILFMPYAIVAPEERGTGDYNTL